MDDSPFAKLPLEIRELIYRPVLCSDPMIILETRIGKKPRICRTSSSSRFLSLMSTCKQIRAETLPIFYGGNTFTIFLPAVRALGSETYGDPACFARALDSPHLWPSLFERWLEQIGRYNTSRLRKVNFDLGTWNIAADPGMLELHRRKGKHLQRSLESIERPLSTAAGLAKYADLLDQVGASCNLLINVRNCNACCHVSVALPLRKDDLEACFENISHAEAAPYFDNPYRLSDRAVEAKAVICRTALRELVKRVSEERQSCKWTQRNLDWAGQPMNGAEAARSIYSKSHRSEAMLSGLSEEHTSLTTSPSECIFRGVASRETEPLILLRYPSSNIR